MVQLLLNFKKRNNVDTNDLSFITDTAPNGVQANGFPSFREITDPSFEQTNYSTVHYKDVALDDNFGFYETFYVRSGTRKIQQKSIDMTVEQKGSDFNSPLFIVGFFGFRPVKYNGFDDVTPTPMYDYFFPSPGINMLGNNIISELKSPDDNAVSNVLRNAHVIPPPIEFAGAASTYSEHPAHDIAFMSSWDHTATAQAGNKIYTTHKMSSPIFNHVIDTSHYGPGIHLEAKVTIYLFKQVHPSTVGNSEGPILEPIFADDVSAFGGFVNVI